MSKTLILYSTVDGHTQRICERIAKINRDAGDDVELCQLDKLDESLLVQYDKILIGASIRYGKYRPALFTFIKRHKDLLESKINGFFNVNVVARKPLKNTPETNPYMQKFLRQSNWIPQKLGVFAGRIDYPQYGRFDRAMIRLIMRLTKGPTDISGSYEFTDWDKVDAFALGFAAH